MSSRNEILASIRRHLPQATELPELQGEWIRYDDPVQQFSEVLAGVGGQCFAVATLDDIPPLLSDLLGEERKIVSCVPGLLSETSDLAQVSDPHELADVELAILPGEVAVAENAAVWVNDQHVPQRVLFFLAQHLALVAPRDQVVSHMLQAYERIDVTARPFGTFISGPSKTADIEQSLVMGAHGARTLRVFIVERLAHSALS